MYLSLSVRIAEAATKDRMTMPFDDFVELAQQSGYRAVCVRASAGGVQSTTEELAAMRTRLDAAGLAVSMVTTDFDVPLNNAQGPNNLRDFASHLDVADALGAKLIRICMKQPDDVAWAQRSADAARERGIAIAHQCHTDSLFEQIHPMLRLVAEIDRENFGIIYEPANLMLCGESYDEDALKRLAPHLMNVYLQNHRLANDGDCALPTRCRGEVRYFDIPLWEPNGVDFEAVFDGLRAIGYDGSVTVHQAFAKLTGPEEAATKSHAFRSRWVETAGQAGRSAKSK